MNIFLSETQQRVVAHDEGALLVIAGPGSGKTRVLTERVRALLQKPRERFKVLALTFSNKAAAEMAERLNGLGEQKFRADVNTVHGFCLDLLADRGRSLGITAQPQIFENYQDRRQVLQQVISEDPWLRTQLLSAGDLKSQNLRVDEWLKVISSIKSHPITASKNIDEFAAYLIQSYDAGLRASGGYDFDDLLVLSYKLLSENPSISDLYRRIYKYICIDEAQDLNEAQYAVITALCGADYKNVMMVGDPKQCIYGFNTSSPKYMEIFANDFQATRITLNENFRSSALIVRAAQSLLPEYEVEGTLPVQGAVRTASPQTEADEANVVVEELLRLTRDGHPDIEGDVELGNCVVLARNRYCLTEVEKALANKGVKFSRRLSAAHEFESDLVKQFLLGLRLVVNPVDRFHLSDLCNYWEVSMPDSLPLTGPTDVAKSLLTLSRSSRSPEHTVVAQALEIVLGGNGSLRFGPALDSLLRHADSMEEELRSFVYHDAEILMSEWDQFLRKKVGNGSPASFLSNMALGTTQPFDRDSLSLMTVHASKGLEFDVVFLIGLAEGVFPDYRALNRPSALQEEDRNAFVAVTRSKRLLYGTYPKVRKMPWGDLRASEPSRYFKKISQVG
ncbi:UvrD-helicase domain-containing protein [Asticcacaulis sp. DW145]|uniref:ATP-dependent helicase n=1 Tax=Asticcacaulis sp. DW145 TaxID=3095608 RepID=UPI0030891F72|nr:UvrD-helicase domain-containing protein [Asticcacaulis sp. DW145]